MLDGKIREDEHRNSPKDTEHVKADSDKSDGMDDFAEFSGTTTLHGLRYIGDQTSILPRRLLWLALVLLCGTLFTIQAWDRIQYFIRSPVTVNFLVKYNKTLAFPAVTICNQNNFRISEAYRTNWFHFIEAIYGDSSQQQDAINDRLRKYPNAKISELYRNLAHRKEDFIVRCQWANEECSVANFTTTQTSHGVCFTFNKVSRPEDSLTIQSSGVEHALRLTLNTERYERMAGPHDTTGIKMLVTDQSQVPMVDEIGLAISTGTHAFVGLTVLTLNNRPPPHGVCGEVDLLSTNRYTQESCMMECKTRFAFKKCGCRHFYMPNLNGRMPLCTVAAFIKCLRGALQSFNAISDKICSCPIPCYYHIYESTVSYATSSHMKADLKGVVDEDQFKDRFFDAKEISNQMDAETRKDFSESVRNAYAALKYLASMMDWHYGGVISVHYNHLELIYGETDEAIKERKTMYEFQEFVVEKNFMRGRDVMEENTLVYVCQDYYGFLRDIEDKLSIIVANVEEDSPVAKVMYLLLKASLGKKKETLIRAMGEYTELVNAYQQGVMVLNYTYQDYDWPDHRAIVPKHLLRESILRDYLKANASLEEWDIQHILQIINNFEVYITNVYEKKTYNTSTDGMRQLILDFQQACETFLSKKSTFYSDVIERPDLILKQKIGTFDDLEREYKAIYNELSASILFQYKSLEEAQGNSIAILNKSLVYAMDYLDTGHAQSVTKYDVANNLASFHVSNDIHRVDLLLDELATRGIEIHEAWTTLENKILAIWKHILNDEDGKDYYEHKSLRYFIQTYKERASEINANLHIVRDIYDIRNGFESIDKSAMDAVKFLMHKLNLYYESHVMDDDFYKENFLQVDVYFKEMRTEKINQQIAYDEIALLCDIGGATGLFIGGSASTVFEIVEFLFLCIVCRICIRKKNCAT